MDIKKYEIVMFPTFLIVFGLFFIIGTLPFSAKMTLRQWRAGNLKF